MMRNTLAIGGLAAVLGLTLMAPHGAEAASCRNRKVTGTVIGGVGGALLGGAVTHGGAGPIIGGLGGAVVGHEIGRSGCRRTVAYRSAPRRAAYAPAPAMRPSRNVYYDRYGQPIARAEAVTRASYVAGCRTTTRSFYDDRGSLISRPVQICD